MAKTVMGVLARIVAKPESVDVVRQGLTALLEPSRGEAGCVVYDLMQNDADPTEFTFYEEWTSGAALDAHSQSAHISAAFGLLGNHIAAAPDVRRYSFVEPLPAAALTSLRRGYGGPPKRSARRRKGATRART